MQKSVSIVLVATQEAEESKRLDVIVRHGNRGVFYGPKTAAHCYDSRNSSLMKKSDICMMLVRLVKMVVYMMYTWLPIM